MNIDKLTTQLTEIIVEYGPKLIGAIVVLILGGLTIKLILRGVKKMMDRSPMDDSLKPFLRSLIKVSLPNYCFSATSENLPADEQ